MNKQIRELDLEKILFFDIETVSRNEEPSIDSKEFELYAWGMRDIPTGFVPPANEVIKQYKKSAALDSAFNKVVVISVGYIVGTTLYYKSIVGTQKEIIEEFYNLVETTGFKVCGHNIIGFDLPTLRIKAWEEGIINKVPNSINDSGKKPWDLEKTMIDTMPIIKGTGYKNMSLDAGCMLKNIESSKDDISGSYVTQVYYQEGVERIAEYCNKDVIASAKLLCSLRGEDDLILECIDRNKKALKEPTTVNVLKHLVASGNLTSKIIEAIIEIVKEEKLDAQSTLDIIKAALFEAKSKEGKNLDKEDYQELKDALGLTIDYSPIQCVVDKGNLGKTQADILIETYKNSSYVEQEKIISLTEDYLVEHSKAEQVTAVKQLSRLKSSFFYSEYEDIIDIVIKDTLGKKESDTLVKKHLKDSKENRDKVIILVENFLTRRGKIEQKRAKEALDLLTKQLS